MLGPRRPRSLADRQQLAQPAVPRRLPEEIRHPRHQRGRHPHTHEKTPRRRRDEVLPLHPPAQRRRGHQAGQGLAGHGRQRLREGHDLPDALSLAGRRRLALQRPISPRRHHAGR
jgi:hypothetical protein